MVGRNHTFYAITSICVVFVYIVSVKDFYARNKVEIDKKLSVDQLNSNFPITFYHNAYVDFRFTPPRLRLFSLNPCINKTDFLVVDVFYEGVNDPLTMKLTGDALEGSCPSGFSPAKPCFYFAHTFFGDLISTGEITKVLVHLGSRKVTLSVKSIDKRYETGMTVCVQPVYYYSQWQNIVLYVEAWRPQGASRFIVFFHSATKETKKVLEYYRKLGIIEIRSWPSFGNLPDEIAGKYPRIDDSVFVFSQFFAMNLCILDIKTTIGAIADFDEVVVPRNGTLLNYALKEMTDTGVGSLRFGNNYVAMEPSIYSSDFSGVANPIFSDKGGPPKYVFNATVIDVAQVHWVRSFIIPKTTKSGDGALLHLRYNIKSSDKKVEKPFKFFPDKTEEHIENMNDAANQIFKDSVPVFSYDLIEGMNSCVQKIHKKKNSCRSSSGICKAEMDSLTEWVYDKTEGIFIS